MSPDELQRKFEKLRAARDNGTLDEAQFRAAVAGLRLPGTDGTWYQVDPVGGGWLRWDGGSWQPCAGTPPFAQRAAPAAKALPEGFLGLLGLILRNTVSSFFRRLPLTLLLAAGALVLHTYLLVAVNNGFGYDAEHPLVWRFIASQGERSLLSSTIIWTVGSTLFMGLLSRLFHPRRRGPTLRERLAGLGEYLHAAPLDAAAVTLAGLGVSLAVSGVMTSYASLALALGFGALLASRGGSVVALLIRSAWSSLFSIARRAQMQRFGVASGYVAMAAGSLGFVAVSALQDAALVLGVVLLGAALALAVATRNAGVAAVIGALGVAQLLGLIDLVAPVLAHDGGLDDPSGGATGTWQSWIKSQGAARAVAYGVAPAAGAGLGPVIYDALRRSFEQLLPDLDGTARRLIDPRYEEPLEERDGKYWVDGEWVSRDEAERFVRDTQRLMDERRREIDARFEHDYRERQASREADLRGKGYRQDEDGNWVSPDVLAERQRERQRAAADTMRERLREHMVKRLEGMASKEGGELREQVNRLLEAGDYAALESLYRDRVDQEIGQARRESRSEQRLATAYGVGEKFAQATLAGSKTAMMVVGGPAGMLATAAGLGVINAAEEGVDAYVREGGFTYKNRMKILGNFAGGFIAGAKDGVVSVYCNVPGMGKLTKILVPAGADAVEMYVRTGDVKRAVVSGGLSIVGDVAGGQIDKLSGPLRREVAGSAVSAAIGGTVSYMNGGGFGEGMLNGMVNRIGGRIGSAAGTAMVERYGPRSEILDVAEPARRSEDQTTAEAEARVKRALDQPKPEQEIVQPENIRKLLRTMHSETVIDTDGETRTTRYVDPQEALDQLTDTRSSRTAKNLPDAERQAIINTRKDKLYAPADQATIERIRDKAGVQKMLQPGDTIEMDTFSTPGKPPSLGADRDARLVIKRPNPAAERGYEIIEIPRKHWENEAYEELYKHTHKLATQNGREMDAEALKVFNERKKELQYLRKPDFSDEYLEKARTRLRAKCEADNERIAKYNEDIEAINQKRRAEGRPEITPLKTRDVGAQVEAGIERLRGQGLTDEQIEHRAWAESKNQLFTDGKHVEASRDNSDQAFSVSRTEDGRIQVTRKQIRSPVLDARDGKAPLQDADGYSRMWSEKSRFYGYGNQNTPEAVAQSQKGIAEYMKLRDGARAGGQEPPPLKPEVAEAMDKILRAPVGHRADQESMDGLNADLRAIRDQNGKPCYTDVNDAMNKIAAQNEYLRFSRPQVDPDAAVTPRVPPAEAPSPPTVTPLREGEVLNLSRREMERSLSREPPTAAAAAEPSATGFATLAEPTARAAAAPPPVPTPHPAAETPPPSAGPPPQRPSAPPDAQAPTPTPSPYGPHPGAAPREPPGGVTAGVTEAGTVGALGSGADIAREDAIGGAAGGLREGGLAHAGGVGEVPAAQQLTAGELHRGAVGREQAGTAAPLGEGAGSLREGGLAHAGGAGEMPAAQQLTAGELHRGALGREQAGTAAPLGEGAGGLREGGLAHAGGAGEMPATEAFTAEELHRETLRRETQGLEQERERLLKELAALRQRLRGEAPGGDEDG